MTDLRPQGLVPRYQVPGPRSLVPVQGHRSQVLGLRSQVLSSRSQVPGPWFLLNMADVKEHCLDSKLQNLLARTSCFLVKTAVELLLKSRKRPISFIALLLSTMELPLFLLIGVLWCFKCNKDECSADKHRH